MAKDLTITGFADRPGAYAAIGEALGKAGINIEGMCGFGGVLHVLVEDGAEARRAIEEAGLRVSETRDVLVVDIEDRPGAWGELGHRLADAGVNLAFVYLATGTRVVLGADDVEQARAAV